MGAGGRPWWVVPLIVVFGVVFYGSLGWIILVGYRWLRRRARSSQGRAFEGLKVFDGPGPGLVGVVFHTYFGVLVFVDQTEHRFWGTPDDAHRALWRLHRFNMCWGMFAYGAILIPFVSLGNYLAQRRSIARQSAGFLD